MDHSRPRRASLKAHSPINWKEQLWKNCLERAREDRAHLIWKIRSSAQIQNQKEIVQTTLRGIVSDELKKLEQSSSCEEKENSAACIDDMLWEYNGLQESSSNEFEHEELLIQMEKLLYEDLRKELIRRELESYEEEEEYLARAVCEQMQLTDDQVVNDDRVWCPICKKGELRENNHLVCCTGCELQLDLQSDMMNLHILRERLGEVYEEHLGRGCKATPKFSMEERFNISALYIQCQACNTFEIVL